jgi:hypothetical protein
MKYFVRLFLAGLALTFLAPASVLATSYTYTSFDLPAGYTLNTVNDINNSEQITGTVWVAAAPYNGSSSVFVKTGANFQLNGPPNAYSGEGGLSNSGLIAGSYEANSYYGNYVYNGTYYSTSYFATFCDINNAGVIVGCDPASKGIIVTYNLETDTNGKPIMTDIVKTFIGIANAQQDVAYKINDNGVIVGTVRKSDNTVSGYIKDGGLTTFMVTNSEETTGLGINNNGDVVGYFTNVGDPTYYGYVRHPDGTFDLIQPFTSSFTILAGINDAGQIVGTYRDAQGHSHGFIGSPVPLPASFLLLGSGLMGLGAAGWRRRRKS